VTLAKAGQARRSWRGGGRITGGQTPVAGHENVRGAVLRS
jgi:hypothetical protein